MKFQIGKQGVTQGVVASLANALKTHKFVRISVLRSVSAERRTHMNDIAQEIIKKLPGTYTYTIIGFVIVLRRRAGKKPSQDL